MNIADLRKAAGLALNTTTKLRKDEPVAMGSLKKICATFNMDFADVVELYQKVANGLVGGDIKRIA